MTFSQPLLVLLILPLGWMIQRLSRERLQRLPWLRALATLATRLLVVALLLLALAGPSVTQAAGGVQVVFVLDRSASIQPAQEAAALAWIQTAVRGMGLDDGASIVAMGSSPAWSGPLSGKLVPGIPVVDATGTNIEAALRLALAGLPANRSARIVLLSDGRQTAGDALLAAQQAAQLHVPISVIPLPVPARGDVAVASVELPHATENGEPVTLRVGLQADRPTPVIVRISEDGTDLGQHTLTVPAGLSTYYFSQTIEGAGTHVFHVQVRAQNDPVPQNDALDAVTVTAPAPSVLMLSGNLAETSSLATALSSSGLQLTVAPAKQAPATTDGLSAYDAVVLADVPAADLSSAAVAALQSAVHDRGMGLLVTGGATSFAAGGYAGTALEQLLPVTSIAEAHTGQSSVALILIIDKSGSMSDLMHGVSKISMAQSAAIQAIAHLQPSDSFGVIAFDDTSHVVLPLQQVGGTQNRDRAKTSILALQAFGNTVIYPALRQAARYLYESKDAFKHIVLMTDGQGETTAPFLQLIKQMKDNGITLSTIAIGSDAEVDELQSWANAGGGRFYYTSDPHDIPGFVVLETRISSGPTRVQGQLAVVQAADDPALRSLVGTTLPKLHSYNIVAAKPSAQVLLQSQLGDPILTQWHDGLGQVTAWTGGSDASWAQSWIAENGFWSDVLHGLLPLASATDFRPDLQLAGQSLTIGVDASNPQSGFADLVDTRAVVVDPAGRRTTLVLQQDAPGHYSAVLSNVEQGVYELGLAQYDNGTVLRQTTDAIAVPYPAEYDIGPPNLNLLAQIAAADNAPTLARPAAAFSPAGLPVYSTQRDVWPVMALLALLIFPLDVALRVLYTPPIPYDPAKMGAEADRT